MKGFAVDQWRSLTCFKYCNTAGSKLPKVRLGTWLNIHLGFFKKDLISSFTRSQKYSAQWRISPPPPPVSLQGRSTLVSPGTLIPRLLYSIILCLDLNNLLTTPLHGTSVFIALSRGPVAMREVWNSCYIFLDSNPFQTNALPLSHMRGLNIPLSCLIMI